MDTSPQVVNTNTTTGRDQRGIVVEIFLDPNNPQGSTSDILRNLEMSEGPILQ
jgi:hypothetical protein